MTENAGVPRTSRANPLKREPKHIEIVVEEGTPMSRTTKYPASQRRAGRGAGSQWKSGRLDQGSERADGTTATAQAFVAVAK